MEVLAYFFSFPLPKLPPLSSLKPFIRLFSFFPSSLFLFQLTHPSLLYSTPISAQPQAKAVPIHLHELEEHTALLYPPPVVLFSEFKLMKPIDSHATAKPFGLKIIVLGGDFRQILAVVSRGAREDIAFSTI